MTRDLDSAESMPFQSWRAKFVNWRIARRRRTVGNVKELPTRAGGLIRPIIESARGRSAEWLESASDLSQADRSRRVSASNNSVAEMLRSMPDISPEPPRSTEECSPYKTPGVVAEDVRHVWYLVVFGAEFVYRLYPFSKFFGNLPEVQFPSSPTGRTFVLDSAAFRNVSAFNGSWKMEKGGKDLYKAQAAFPQTKKIHHKFEGHIRYLIVIPYSIIPNISHSFC